MRVGAEMLFLPDRCHLSSGELESGVGCASEVCRDTMKYVRGRGR